MVKIEDADPRVLPVGSTLPSARKVSALVGLSYRFENVGCELADEG
jgi:hypothetical protein